MKDLNTIRKKVMELAHSMKEDFDTWGEAQKKGLGYNQS